MSGISPKVTGQTIAHLAVWAAASLAVAWMVGGKPALATAVTGVIATVVGSVTGYQVATVPAAPSTIALPSGGSITEEPHA
jgi:hypothetical protein